MPLSVIFDSDGGSDTNVEYKNVANGAHISIVVDGTEVARFHP